MRVEAVFEVEAPVEDEAAVEGAADTAATGSGYPSRPIFFDL